MSGSVNVAGWERRIPANSRGEAALSFWDVAWSGAVGSPTLPVWNITGLALTALYNSLGDSSAAIASAITKANTLGVTLVGRGTYRVDSLVQLVGDADFRGCVFLSNNPAGAVVRVGDPTTILMGLTITVPRVLNVANVVTTWASGTSRGVEVVSIESSHISFMGAEFFKTGVYFTTNLNIGTVYNEFHFYKFINNHISVHCKPNGGNGWINENLFIGGKFSHTTDKGTDYAGARHLLIEEYEDTTQLSGTAASATATTLTSAAVASVTANEYQLYILEITGGTGAGQKRVISSHTAGTTPVFSLGSIWGTVPDATSTYEVFDSSKSNNNWFIKPSWEGNAAEYFLECRSLENLFVQPRMERHSGVADVLFTGPLAINNEFRAGYGGATAVISETNGSYGNEVKTTNRKRFNGDVVVTNGSSSNNPAVFVMPSSATMASDPTTAYATSIAASRTRWKNTTDTEPRVEITNATSRIDFGPGGSTATDTNLYRNAANVLKTDDKFLAALGIGVGNSAAGSTPGTCVKKMEVFDASGASLGFVPIYNAIT